MINKIQVGKIINTHGLKGELKVLPLTDDPQRFNNLNKMYIDNKEYIIEKVWYKKGFPIITIQNFNDINDVLIFKNKYIYITQEDMIELEEDTYFIFQIKGLNVVTVDGIEIGTIKDVLTPGANDVYVVKGKDKEYLIPAVKEFVKEIDLEEKKMVIMPIEGLLE
ncbi:ribosome maturation factor RimM [Clostridium sp. D2Q-11]|uniref:Ribosome maturation factor RimM n=1 Tax=Anaeromonas frigoriresistens TaxID=2683708 RepID=A0A942UV24_9FIRM|nr:ribosome maturation factor RimM [Anaeromonas frigoriresistens]MBS4539774.1 ribosome maturation factor RimM [Anaeromonas frigoriresistens]